jgi:site-specific recombinase XerD
MAIKKLTKSVIDSLPIPDDGRVTYWDTELKGFCIRISRTARTYYAKKRVMGKPQWVKIGEHGLLTPDEARKEALNILSDLNKGVDVNKQKAQDRIRGITLEKALEEYFTSKPQLREGSRRTYECLLNEWLSDWMEKPIEEIGKSAVAKRHLKIANERSEVSANNVMRTFRAVYNHAQALSDGALPENPTKILSHSRQWFQVGRRQTVIKEHQLRAWHDAVRSYSNPVAGDALLVLLFTGCREQEVLTLQWSDVDMKARTFRIRPEIAKNHREHTLPMFTYVQCRL